jgi:hypothetical protein
MLSSSHDRKVNLECFHHHDDHDDHHDSDAKIMIVMQISVPVFQQFSSHGCIHFQYFNNFQVTVVLIFSGGFIADSLRNGATTTSLSTERPGPPGRNTQPEPEPPPGLTVTIKLFKLPA